MSDLIELKNKVEEAAKALHDERKHYEELKAEQSKGRISEAELKARIEKLEKVTDKIEDQKEALEKVQAAVQRIGTGAEEKAGPAKVDTKAMSQAVKTLLKGGLKFDKTALAHLSEVEKKALSNSIAEDGGIRVLAERDTEIGRILYDTSNLRSVARVVTVGTNRWEKVSKDSNGSAAWANEIATRSAQDSAVSFLTEIPVHEIYSWQDVTEQHIEDASYDVIGETSVDAATAISLAVNTALITGNGAGQPRGITTYTTKTAMSTYERGKVGTKTTASAGAITFDELMDVQDALKVGYLPNASWLMARSTRSLVRKLKYTSGTNEYIWEMSTQVGVPSNMLGHPVQIMEDMPAVATGAISMVFGDIRQAYVIVDRLGMSMLDDPFTASPYRRLKYRVRVGGGLVNYDAIKYLKQA